MNLFEITYVPLVTTLQTPSILKNKMLILLSERPKWSETLASPPLSLWVLSSIGCKAVEKTVGMLLNFGAHKIWGKTFFTSFFV